MKDGRVSLLTQVIAGVSIFGAMSYIVVVNPVVLSGQLAKADTGMSLSALFFATCLTAAIGSLLIGAFANVPTALAPAMGINVFFVNFIVSTQLPWQVGLFFCGIAAFIFVIFSSVPTPTSWRRQFLIELPDPIKFAVISSIGAVLIEAAIRFVHPGGGALDWTKIGLFFLGIATILVFKFIRIGGKHVFDPLGYIASIAVIVGVTLWWDISAVYSPPLPIDRIWIWSGEWDALINGLTRQHITSGVVLCLVVLYILMADFVGTAANDDLVPPHPEREAKISKAFRFESLASLFSPVVGTTPTVCYAENIVGQTVAKAATGQTTKVLLSGVPAIVAGACFLVIFAIGLLAYATSLGQAGPAGAVPEIKNYIPTIAVAPVLFLAGVLVLADSLYHQAFGSDGSARTEVTDWIPAAISITTLQLVGLEYALGFGALSYYIYQLGARNAQAFRHGLPLLFVILFAFAVWLHAIFTPR
jgi:AGZA family xanthine/uracil permease-like MFS transporter